MKAWGPYNNVIKSVLKDPKMAAIYINTALEEKDWSAFILALRRVVEVHSGSSELTKKEKLHRSRLYRGLAGKNNPDIHKVFSILHALGFRLTVSPNI